MKCVYCNAEMLEGKDKCDYCGKYQHDHKKFDQNDYNNFGIKPENNNNKVFLTIIKIIVIVAIIAVIGYFIIDYINHNNHFNGSWRCISDQSTITNFIIDKKIIKIKSSSSGYREADYYLEREVKEEDNIKYYLNVSATKILANGQQFVDSNETSFEITMDLDDYNKIIIKNTITGNSYDCYSEK